MQMARGAHARLARCLVASPGHLVAHRLGRGCRELGSFDFLCRGTHASCPAPARVQSAVHRRSGRRLHRGDRCRPKLRTDQARSPSVPRKRNVKCRSRKNACPAGKHANAQRNRARTRRVDLILSAARNGRRARRHSRGQGPCTPCAHGPPDCRHRRHPARRSHTR